MLVVLVPATAGGTVVATGDDLVVYSKDIDILKDVYSQSGFETTPKEYLDAMLKIRLFAREAQALKLGGPLVAGVDGSLSTQAEMTTASLKKLFEFYALYVKYIYDQYPVSDAAIESYYLAFPEKTTKSGDAPLTYEFFRPNTLDDELKQIIRGRLLQNKKPGLLENEFERLSQKYHLKVVSGN
jgi:hypothetical protein